MIFKNGDAESIINLKEATNMANISTPCLFSGQLQDDPSSIVSVSGCKDDAETTISLSGKSVPGGLIDLVIIDGTSHIVPDQLPSSLNRRFNSENHGWMENDVLEMPESTRRNRNQFRGPLPSVAELSFDVMYDNTLLEYFDDDHQKTQQ